MMLICDKVSYVAPCRMPWQSLKRWHEVDLYYLNTEQSHQLLKSTGFRSITSL